MTRPRLKLTALLTGVLALGALAAYAARQRGRSAPGPKTAAASRGTIHVRATRDAGPAIAAARSPTRIDQMRTRSRP